MAKATGLSVSAISRIETGEQGYTRNSLEAIADALETRPGFLLEVNPLSDL